MASRKRTRAIQGSGAPKKRQKKKHPESDQEEDHVVVTEYPATDM
jgi:hypothetical protein